jgi:hypothetical protein
LGELVPQEENMSTLGVNAAVALAALLIILGFILYASLAAAFRVVRGDGRLRLAEMLRRQGTAEQALDVGGYEAAVAVRRCMMCAHKAQCDEWSGAKRGMEKFCPNADFIARVAGSRLHST